MSSALLAHLREVVDQQSSQALPSPAAIAAAEAALPAHLPDAGWGDDATIAHILTDLAPAFNGSKSSAHYYGFVTGGVVPVAEAADFLVTAYDQNVQVHLPHETVSTTVEAKTMALLAELLGLGAEWRGTLTTGATGSNIVGLACGREAVISKKLAGATVASLGLLHACTKAGIAQIQVLTSCGHSSLAKAASVVGLGHHAVKEIGQAEKPWKLDVVQLEEALSQPDTASIVSVSLGEVNTGRYAVADLAELSVIRAICDCYGAWLHCDAAFGFPARILPEGDEFEALRSSVAGLHLMDSITADAHKSFNVPYDSGIFLTRHLSTLSTVFQNPNAAYLTAGVSDIPSPLNIGLENSRRFRALPIYAVLLSLGRSGLVDLFTRQIRFARTIAKYIHASDHYDLLPGAPTIDWDDEAAFKKIGIIVLFRARDNAVNQDLVRRINGSRKIYVSGTAWRGEPACRFAISTWKIDPERDLALIAQVLDEAIKA